MQVGTTFPTGIPPPPFSVTLTDDDSCVKGKLACYSLLAFSAGSGGQYKLGGSSPQLYFWRKRTQDVNKQHTY